MVTLVLSVGRSVSLIISGVQMIRESPAVQKLLSSLLMMPHCVVTQHSGPMYPVLYITVVVLWVLMVNDALPTNNTVTIPGTLGTIEPLKNTKVPSYQVVRTSLTEYSS